jgi:hypothetical protein
MHKEQATHVLDPADLSRKLCQSEEQNNFVVHIVKLKAVRAIRRA